MKIIHFYSKIPCILFTNLLSASSATNSISKFIDPPVTNPDRNRPMYSSVAFDANIFSNQANYDMNQIGNEVVKNHHIYVIHRHFHMYSNCLPFAVQLVRLKCIFVQRHRPSMSKTRFQSERRHKVMHWSKSLQWVQVVEPWAECWAYGIDFRTQWTSRWWVHWWCGWNLLKLFEIQLVLCLSRTLNFLSLVELWLSNSIK